jgi:subtilisin family serine protease
MVDQKSYALTISVLCVLGGLAGCRGKAPQPTPKSKEPGAAAPAWVKLAPPPIDPRTTLPNVGFIEDANKKRYFFRTDRLSLRAKKPLTNEELLDALKETGATELLPPPMPQLSRGSRPPDPKSGKREPRPAQWGQLRIPGTPGNDQLAKRQAELLKAFSSGKRLNFSSPEAANAVGYLLLHNSRLGDRRPAVLDSYLTPTQLLTSTSETSRDPNYPLSTLNFQMMDMRRAWRLAQGASNTSTKPVRVAIVDQGFRDAATGLSFAGGVIEKGANEDGLGFGVPSIFNDWHGMTCASAVGATVNDSTGAAGSAFFLNKASPTTSPFNVELVAVSVPEPTISSFARYILRAVDRDAGGGAADIVSMSWSLACDGPCRELGQADGWTPLSDALEAASKVAPVFVSAGNSGWDLDQHPNEYQACGASSVNCIHCATADCPLDRYFRIPCESPNALCVGGLTGGSKRWVTGMTEKASNYGKAIAAWGPAQFVVVNPPDSSLPFLWVSGTSLATPFVAGMLAFSETTWPLGKRPAAKDVRALLARHSRGVSDIEPDIQTGVLSAYELVRENIELFEDKHEPDDTLADAKAKVLPDPKAIFTLHDANDRDLFAFSIPAQECADVTATFDYILDSPRGNLQVKLFKELAEQSATLEQRSAIDERSEDGMLKLTAKLCTGDYSLEVSQTDRLTTPYSVSFTQENPPAPTALVQ